MSVKELIPVILGVIKDIRVIITIIAMLVVIEFATFVINYTKKAPKPKKQKNSKKAPAPKPAEPAAEEVDAGEAPAAE